MLKKAIIPIAGLGTRFLPLSKAVPKEFLPLADKPIIRYLLEEALSANIKEIIFIVRPGKKEEILEYFKKSPKLEKILKERKKEQLLAELKTLEEFSKNFKFSFVNQRKPLGDGHAILQAKKLIGKEPSGVFFVDDVVDSKISCFSQLLQIFKTCQKPIVALKKLSKEKLPAYGVAAVEKIASRVYKIKKIVEKPSIDSVSSDLAVAGRYIITPEVFDYLGKLSPNQKGEIILADALEQMIKDGKMVYGKAIEGEWLECGDKLRWLHSHLYFTLKHPKYGPELKKYLKEII